MLAVLVVAVPLRAALWESSSWVLNGSAEGTVVYDSNIMGRAGGEGDAIGMLRPALRLERRGSLTQMELYADATIRRFRDHPEEDSVDPTARFVFAYPYTDQDLPLHEVVVDFHRISYPDLDVEARLRRTRVGAEWSGQIIDTGKSRLRGTLAANSMKYDPVASKTEGIDAGLQLGFRPNPLLELGGGLSYSVDRFDDSTPGEPVLERQGLDFVFSARGELTPKLTGRISAGPSHSSYSSSVSGADWNWVTRANLNWQLTERRSVNLVLNRSPRFSADGNLGVNSLINLSFSQDIAGGFKVVPRVAANVVSQSSDGLSDYKVYSAGVVLSYNLTGKLIVELAGDLQQRRGSGSSGDYSRYVISGGATYRF